MDVPHDQPTPPGGTEWPVLLMAACAAMFVAVALIWLLGAVDTTLAVVPPVAAAILGALFVLWVINRQIGDDDDPD